MERGGKFKKYRQRNAANSKLTQASNTGSAKSTRRVMCKEQRICRRAKKRKTKNRKTADEEKFKTQYIIVMHNRIRKSSIKDIIGQ